MKFIYLEILIKLKVFVSIFSIFQKKNIHLKKEIYYFLETKKNVIMLVFIKEMDFITIVRVLTTVEMV